MGVALCLVFGPKQQTTKSSSSSVEHSVTEAMDQVNWDYSTKNVPIPSDQEYCKVLIDKTSDFLKRAKWRAFFFLNPTQTTAKKETFGFKSTNSLPNVPELKELEEKMLELIQSVENKQNFTMPKFQKQMVKDIKEIKKTKEMIIKADKTNNHYKVSKEANEKLMQENIQKEYKKTTQSCRNENNCPR